MLCFDLLPDGHVFFGHSGLAAPKVVHVDGSRRPHHPTLANCRPGRAQTHCIELSCGRGSKQGDPKMGKPGKWNGRKPAVQFLVVQFQPVPHVLTSLQFVPGHLCSSNRNGLQLPAKIGLCVVQSFCSQAGSIYGSAWNHNSSAQCMKRQSHSISLSLSLSRPLESFLTRNTYTGMLLGLVFEPKLLVLVALPQLWLFVVGVQQGQQFPCHAFVNLLSKKRSDVYAEWCLSNSDHVNASRHAMQVALFQSAP